MKKSLSLLLVLTMLVSLFAGLSMHALAADDAALTVYLQAGENGAVPIKSYTAENLSALAEKSDGNAYVYYKGDAANAVVATEYVTLSRKQIVLYRKQVEDLEYLISGFLVYRTRGLIGKQKSR